MTLPVLEIGHGGGGREEMMRLLAEACIAYAARNTRQAADMLCAAETVGRNAGLHREAAKIRKAITILGSGGKPRLLVRGVGYLDNE